MSCTKNNWNMTTATQSITTPPLTLTDAPTYLAICFSTRATLPMLAQLGHVPPRLYDEAARLGLTITGPVQYIYEGATGAINKEFTLTIALPIQEMEAGILSEEITVKTIPGFRCATCTYTGSWDTLMALYGALFPAFYAQGYTYNGQLREVYRGIDREEPGRCVTDIQIGVG